jgi:hypothetical protein
MATERAILCVFHRYGADRELIRILCTRRATAPGHLIGSRLIFGGRRCEILQPLKRAGIDPIGVNETELDDENARTCRPRLTVSTQ